MPELWPFRPLFEISETLEWLSEVLPSRTGEQRIALRSAPRQVFNYAHMFDPHKYMWAKAFVRRNGASTVAVPVWLESTTVGSVGSSQTVITLDTTTADYRVGGYIVVWQGWDRCALATIDSLTDTNITITEAIGTDFVNAIVAPVREAFFTQGLRSERIPTATRSLVRFQVNDNLDLNTLGEFSLYPQYQSMDVVTDSPHATASVAESVIRTSEFIDNGFGPVAIEPIFNYSELGQTITFLENLGSELWSRRRWLHSLRGRQKAFWLPSFNNDLELQNTVLSSGTELTVKRISIPSFYVGRHVMIELRNGNRYYREITNAIVDGDNDVLTISSSLGETLDPDEVLYISFISKVRLNADTISLDHRVAGIISIIMPIAEVQQ